MDITDFVVSQREKALSVGDHALYTRRLSRRLLVVRKKLNYTSKGRKYAPKPPITAKDIERNHEYFTSLLTKLRRLIYQVHQSSPSLI